MTPPFQFAALLITLFSIADAKVDFSYSTMYDIYDIAGKEEIDPFNKNLTINEATQGHKGSISEAIGKRHPDTSQKLPLDIAAAGNYSLVNLNPQEDYEFLWDVIIWIVERAKAGEINYAIYDANQMDKVSALPNSVLTIMGSQTFPVSADKLWEERPFTARLVGFDNAFDDNEDLCEPIATSPVGALFNGFKFFVPWPIISFVFANATTITLSKDSPLRGEDGSKRSLSTPGFITSPGYTGCKRLGADQVYRDTFYYFNKTISLNGHQKSYQVDIECTISDSNEDSLVEVIDETNGHTIPISGRLGRQHYKFTLPNTQNVSIRYTNMSSPNSFFLTYTATGLSRLSPPRQSTSPSKTSTTMATSTTSTTQEPENIKDSAIISDAHDTTTSSTAALSTMAIVFVACIKLLAP